MRVASVGFVSVGIPLTINKCVIMKGLSFSSSLEARLH